MKKFLSVFLSVFFISSIICFNKTEECKASEDVNFDVHIKTPEDFKNFIIDFNNGFLRSDCKVVLEEDIIIDGRSLSPIGSEDRPFSGTFEGNLKGITLLVQNEDSKYALFGCTNHAILKNIIVNGYIISQQCAGIVIKAMDTSIINCNNYANIRATKYVAAGIALYLYNSTLTDCYNGGVIYSIYNAAGIAFVAKESNFDRCLNYAPVSCSYGFLSGILSVAKSGCYLRHCYNDFNCLFFITRKGEKTVKMPMANLICYIDDAAHNYSNDDIYINKKFAISKNLVGLLVGENIIINGENDLNDCIGVFEIEK